MSDPKKDAAAYERHKGRAAERQRQQSKAGRDLGEIPPPADLARRVEGGRSFRHFLETYFPERFPLAWSADHLKVIALVERTVLEGGLFALAMPRGAGKTTICECAALWAALYGYHRFIALVGATGELAANILASIKTELEANDLLAEDFPEVCMPVRELEGRAQRCGGQTYRGERTLIQWRRNFVVLPLVPGSAASEAVVRTFAILGSIRGVKYTRADGSIARPTLAIPDDPQTDESAPSPLQCARRLKVLNGAILKLAGPGKKISALCPCTVIVKGDMADKLLDREKNPHWNGERCKTLYAFPQDMEPWKKYAVLRADGMRASGHGKDATEFYRANRAAMDVGAHVAWPQRFDPDHVSALETAMVRYFEDRYSFFAEDQNDPQDEQRAEDDLTPADLAGRYSGRPRGLVPAWADVLTASIDVQKTLLYWMVCGWRSADFTGSVVAYGTWPEQTGGRRYFTLRDAAQTIADAMPGEALEAQIRRALDDCEAFLLDRDWMREDGTAMRVRRAFKDSGYEMRTVFEQSRASRFASVSMPSRGVPLGPGETPMMDYRKKDGEDLKNHVLLTTPRGYAVRWAKMDANYWKAAVVSRLKQAIGSPGALTLYGRTRQDADHDMLIDHLCAEKSHLHAAKGRTVRVFEQLPGADNHWLDTLYGCAAAAAVEGVALAGQQPASSGPRRAAASPADAAKRRAEFEQRRRFGR